MAIRIEKGRAANLGRRAGFHGNTREKLHDDIVRETDPAIIGYTIGARTSVGELRDRENTGQTDFRLSAAATSTVANNRYLLIGGTEVVQVTTARSTSRYTVVRARFGTEAGNWPSGTDVSLIATASGLTGTAGTSDTLDIIGANTALPALNPGIGAAADGGIDRRWLRIGSEWMRVTAATGSLLASPVSGVTVNRTSGTAIANKFGTTSAAHNTGVAVYLDGWGPGRDPMDHATYGDFGIGADQAHGIWFDMGRKLTGSSDKEADLLITVKGVEDVTDHEGSHMFHTRLPLRALLDLGERTINPLTGAASNSPPGLSSKDRSYDFYEGGNGRTDHAGALVYKTIDEADRYRGAKIGDISGAFGSTSTLLNLKATATAQVRAGDYLNLRDTEIVRVTGITSQQIFTVVRGQLGTSATSHADDVDVKNSGPLIGEIGNTAIGLYTIRSDEDNLLNMQTRFEIIGQ